jgi:ribosomal protein S18 acetylase RimI-like enzyme
MEPPRDNRPPVRLAVASPAGSRRRLLDALDERARTSGARRLWLETQNVNYPAIQFYYRSGFRLCGLDDTLYDPESDPTIGPDEVALFFTRPI